MSITNTAQRYQITGQSELGSGYFEAPPLADRHSDQTDPQFVGVDGLLRDDIGILWIKDSPDAEASSFYYVGWDELEAV